MSAVKHVSFEELASNLAELLNQVRDEHISIVVKYAGGETLLIKPFSPSRLSDQDEQRGESEEVADDITEQQPANQSSDPGTKSAMGAIYDLDPNSITPG